MAAADDRLANLRACIDGVDDELLKLLNERAAATIEIGKIKRAAGEEARFYRPDREAEILRRVKRNNPGPMPEAHLLRLVREIMSACLSLEQVLRVTYLGPAETFTHAAVAKHFGADVEAVAVTNIGEVFREVEACASAYGIVPIENSLEGSVNQTLDCLAKSSLRMCGEVVLAVHHQLLSNAGGLAAIARVYAHEQALAQCRGWLDDHLRGAERIAVSSNAAAAEKAATESGAGAIASAQAGERYGLAVLGANIEDHPQNTTRFAVLGRSTPEPTGDDITSIVFSMPNKPGALHDVLGVLSDSRISMTKIESRPLRMGKWDYIFFVDFVGHADDPGVAAVIERIEGRTALFKILGSCPRAVL